ncbi:ankyrin repeat-rich membrane spanning isoform X1 [Lycorma delicatula]
MVSLCYRTLLNFISDDNLVALQSYLENKRVLVDDRDENGSTALHFATSKGKLAFVRELINHGADVNLEDNDNWTPLLCAAKEGHTDVCSELLDHGANIEHRDMGGWSALMWATYKGHKNTVALLLERNADVNAHGNYHISSLLWAAGRGYVEIVKMLVRKGAKINVGDKYGTTALVWACRKGNAEIVDCLLKAGANVDTAGMYSWTPLLVAAMGNHVEVVNLLLEYRPNVNALDKDGCTALTIACKEGYHDIAVALLNVGVYINIQDRSGDTNLIHAVKGGHRSVVEALLKKYADVDIPGKERKTATYTAVEKGNIPVLKLLLTANPDLEVATKDGDTPLLRAVRSRNTEAVQLLLEKKAKVSACDKRGDTALHIAMRARSKGIIEVLLRNPKNSQLLYRPNRAGETPYNIDMNHQKTILGQIFGARRLNTNEDNENLLGYDLYSSALADILSEPSLSMPITVGLYAKWGSGKSFLLNKLREEMKNFARQWVDPMFQFSWLLLALLSHVVVVIGVATSLIFNDWIIGSCVTGGGLIIVCVALILLWYGSQKYTWDWPYNLNVYLTQKMNAIKVVLQVIFCHPPGRQWSDSVTAQPIRFYFTDQTRVSSTTAGENSVVQMMGSLYDSIENDYGALSTRLYRAFRPKPLKSTANWRWRRLCCMPNIATCELCFLCLLVMAASLTALVNDQFSYLKLDNTVLKVILISCSLVVLLCVVANLYTIGRMFNALIFSQRIHLQRAIARLDTLKSEGFLQALRCEVNLMTEMVKCLDAFTQQQTRLVIIVDGLDSCEQDKVLLVLDAIHILFSDSNTPFIIILAIDPHVISKAVEVNSRRLLSESNIGGHDYLRNMVHLPFFLQNSGLRKVKMAQKSSQSHRKSVSVAVQQYEPSTNTGSSQPEGTLVTSGSSRRLSTESGLSSQEKLKIPQLNVGNSSSGGGKRGSRKLKLSESIASSLGSNLNRAGGAHDLTKMLLTDDYFSDVNPRSMRRLMNVVYITGRLLKAFQIDFNWYHLASWINITEQWPYRTSWLILYHDLSEDAIDDNMSLKTLYDKIRPQIPTSKDVEPLLELDRDERKFDIFLTFHRSSLLVSDLRVFLPFTINLDPYIKKVIKEDQQNLEEAGLLMMSAVNNPSVATPASIGSHGSTPLHWQHDSTAWGLRKSNLLRRQRSFTRGSSATAATGVVYPTVVAGTLTGATAGLGWPSPASASGWLSTPEQSILSQHSLMKGYPLPPAIPTPLPTELLDIKLSSLSTEGVCHLLSKIEELQAESIPRYINLIQTNNISGRVLMYCDFEELKKVLQMNFGDWELFRMVVASLREHEVASVSLQADEQRNVRFVNMGQQQNDKRGGSVKSQNSQNIEKDRVAAKQSVIEKQVTLEEQMICGALQTLNEEACEDVLEEAEEQQATSSSQLLANNMVSITGAGSTLGLQVPEQGVGSGGNSINRCIGRSRTLSQGSCASIAEHNETDVLILQQSPVHPSCWTATPYESQSDVSSVCDTPPLLRSRRGSKVNGSGDEDRKLSMNSLPNSRPSSLLVSIPCDIESQNCSSNVVTSNNDQTLKHSSAASILSNLSFSSILGGGGSAKNGGSPCVTVTPACSIDALTRIRGYQETGNGSSDDESTPLVSEISSPSVGPGRTSGESNRGFGNVESPGSSEMSPTSIKSTSTQDVISSSESLSKVLEGVEGFYNFALVESPKGREVVTNFDDMLMHSNSHSSSGVASILPRQDAVDSDDDVTKSNWNDPETAV